MEKLLCGIDFSITLYYCSMRQGWWVPSFVVHCTNLNLGYLLLVQLVPIPMQRTMNFASELVISWSTKQYNIRSVHFKLVQI